MGGGVRDWGDGSCYVGSALSWNQNPPSALWVLGYWCDSPLLTWCQEAPRVWHRLREQYSPANTSTSLCSSPQARYLLWFYQTVLKLWGKTCKGKIPSSEAASDAFSTWSVETITPNHINERQFLFHHTRYPMILLTKDINCLFKIPRILIPQNLYGVRREQTPTSCSLISILNAVTCVPHAK